MEVTERWGVWQTSESWVVMHATCEIYFLDKIASHGQLTDESTGGLPMNWVFRWINKVVFSAQTYASATRILSVYLYTLESRGNRGCGWEQY